MAKPPPGQFDARRLREARLALGLNQGQVAERVGVDPGVFNSWETRGARPSVRNLARVAFALGLSVSDLYVSHPDFVGTLIDLRVHAGLTQRQLAAELGVKQTRLSRWETGLARPTSVQAGLYAVILGCDEDTLRAAIDRTPRRTTKGRRPREALGGSPNSAGIPAGTLTPVVGDLGQVGGGTRGFFLDLSQWSRLQELEQYAEDRSIDLGNAIRELVEHALSLPATSAQSGQVTEDGPLE